MDAKSIARAVALQEQIRICTVLIEDIGAARNATIREAIWTDDKGKAIPPDDHGNVTPIMRDVARTGSVLRQLVVSRPDKGEGRSLLLPDDLAITADETDAILETIVTLLEARIASYQTEMKGL